MKALLFTVALLVLGDFAINHGDATHHTIASVHGFFTWLGAVGEDSIFTR